MTGNIHAVAASVPSYCHGLLHTITPAQWQQCWNIGIHEPTTGAANAGYTAGHDILPVVIVVVIILAALAMLRSGRSAAAQGS